MARFQFKLDPLLRLRRRAEQANQRIVAELERERVGIEERIRRQQEDLRRGKSALRTELNGSLNVLDLRHQAQAAIQVRRKANHLVLLLAGLHKRLEKARAELIDSTQQRRAIELLRDRRFAVWRERETKLELAAADELSTNAAARKETVPCPDFGA